MNSVAQTHYLVYAITNTINNKIYIGCHKTKNPDDNYMGSGKYLKRAQKRYGVDSFVKEILLDFGTSEEMYQAEVQLITDLNPEYNLHEGGRGGWDYVNANIQPWIKACDAARSVTAKNKRSESQKALQLLKVEKYNENPRTCKKCHNTLNYNKRSLTFCSISCANRGRTISEETREKISDTYARKYGKTERCRSCGTKIRRNNKTGYCQAHYARSPSNKILNSDLIKSIKKDRKTMSVVDIQRKYQLKMRTVYNAINS